MIYGSVCSGIEAATVAWHPLGWKPAFFSEIEKFPRALLSHHYPDVPLHGDFTTIKGNEYGAIDLLCGGTPCQSFSVAGLRKGLTDDRGNLTLEFIRLAERTKPRWLVWENVPGVLSSNGGRDFAAFLGGLAEWGYGFSYRVLDAQHFGVPQRRRRVVLVGHLGDWRPAAAVLFEREGLRGDITPRREKREGVAGYAATSFGKYDEGVGTLRSDGGDLGGGSETLAVFGIQSTMIGRQDHNGPNGKGYAKDVSFTLTKADHHAVAFGVGENPDLAHCLRSGASRADKHESTTYIAIGLDEEQNAHIDSFGCLKARTDGGGFEGSVMQKNMQVRRLTPRECERLQGFPDDYTKISETTADSPRYKAIGNSWAVPKFRWLGERIQMVENLINPPNPQSPS